MVDAANPANGAVAAPPCIAGVPQQYTLTVSSNSNPNQTSPPVTTVITDPAAPTAPNGAGAAYKLVWLQTPTGGTAFSPVTPQPEVAVEDIQGDIVTSDFSSATLSLVSGPGTISSTCAGVESYGIVQFTDCSMSAAGAYTINAVDGSLVPAGNTSFTVQAATASKIGFTTAAVLGDRIKQRHVGAGHRPATGRFRQPRHVDHRRHGQPQLEPGWHLLGDTGRCRHHVRHHPCRLVHREHQLLLRRHDCRIPDDHRILIRSALRHADRVDHCWGGNPVGDHQHSVLDSLPATRRPLHSR